MQINVIQFGSFGCARTATKMIRSPTFPLLLNPAQIAYM